MPLPPRQQGALGEASATDWLRHHGYVVWIPLGHSADVDLMATRDDDVVKVQVKTSTVFRNLRWDVTLCTRGGNQSWNGLVKHFNSARCDHLFVLVGDGRRWFIPATEVEGGSGIRLGGPKYAAFEVEPGRPLITVAEAAR